jgi:hypothetical protein
MTREQLLKAIRKWCRANGVPFALDMKGGKGGHYKVAVGDRWTIIQASNLHPHYIDAVLRQLGIPKGEIKR